jgi:hypothetical protein
VNDERRLRALLPPITPGLILRALLGVLLFFCGIVLGAWLIFRFRRHVQDGNAERRARRPKELRNAAIIREQDRQPVRAGGWVLARCSDP